MHLPTNPLRPPSAQLAIQNPFANALGSDSMVRHKLTASVAWLSACVRGLAFGSVADQTSQLQRRSSGTSNTNTIVGIVLGVVLGLFLIGLCTFVYIYRESLRRIQRRRRRSQRSTSSKSSKSSKSSAAPEPAAAEEGGG